MLRSVLFRPKRNMAHIVVSIEIAVTIIVRRKRSSNIECKNKGIEIENVNTAKIGSTTFLIYDETLS